ncbi:MAG: YgfZ/GcvT domain-containing protein [Acidimicrobiales bacterium]
MVELEVAERLAIDDVVAVITERDLLVVNGPDAASYLHGQISQNAEGLAVGNTVWTLLLQPQGKVEAWLRMHRRSAEEFWLDVESGFGEQAKARLERFKLRVDADIHLVTTSMVALRGPRAATVAAEQAAVASGEPLVALDASWASVTGVDLVDPSGVLADADRAGEATVQTWVPDGVTVGPAETLEVLRIRQGRPAMGSELDDSTIPAAAGVVERSVDFTKGCYVGQELVARIDSRGNNTPTRLYGLRFSGPELPAVGSELSLDGAAAGTVTSVAVSPDLGSIGLAYLKRAVEVPASLTATSANGSPLTVEAIALPNSAQAD